jgi:hypothetical protein
MMAKGILKSPSAAIIEETEERGELESTATRGRRGSHKLQWDEEKLRQNALELEALEHAHPVDEPKTPYARMSSSPERSLSDGAIDEVNGGGGGSFDESDSSINRKHSWSTTASEPDDDNDHHDNVSNPDLLHVHTPEEEQRFLKHRREHYQMRNALLLGKQLLLSDPEVDDNDDGDGK